MFSCVGKFLVNRLLWKKIDKMKVKWIEKRYERGYKMKKNIS